MGKRAVTQRTNNAAQLGRMMTAISDLNSFCFVPEARRIMDETLTQLEKIRLNHIWSERAAERKALDEALDDCGIV